MKVVISGSRHIEDYDLVARAIAESGFIPTLIIEGGQRTWDDDHNTIIGGVDYFAEVYARRNRIPWKRMNAKWSEYGKAAGPIRNREMATEGDALIALPKSESRGTRNMILAMTLQGKPTFVKEC